jgi:hypothetical protein
LPRVFFCFVCRKNRKRRETPRKAPFLLFSFSFSFELAKENENLKKTKKTGFKEKLRQKKGVKKKNPKRAKEKKGPKTGKKKKEKNDAQQKRQPYHFIPLLMFSCSHVLMFSCSALVNAELLLIYPTDARNAGRLSSLLVKPID